MNKLLFDTSVTGHHSEYISHLIDYIAARDSKTNYFFVVNPNFKSIFPQIIKKSSNSKNINWIEINEKEYAKIQNYNMIKKSFYNFKIMNMYSKSLDIDSVTLLYFNIFQLAIIFFRPKYSLEGILFLQFSRMNRKKIKDKIKYYRKYLITKLYIINPSIKKIFLLNDEKSVKYLNKTFNTKKFEMLPDPIPNLKSIPNFNIFQHFNINVKSKIFLHIGSLGDRKGTFEILESAYEIPKNIQEDLVFLFVGKISPEKERERFEAKIKEIKTKTDVKIIFDNNFISNELMKSLFDQCFGVLIPYKNTEASSGILGHAANSNKKVISTGKGLIKQLVVDNDLGYLIDEVHPKLIAEKIIKMLQEVKNDLEISPKTKIFLNNHTQEKFAKKILE